MDILAFIAMAFLFGNGLTEQPWRYVPPMAKIIKKLNDLTPDPMNVNKGSERGHSAIEWSLTELGAGRSILADADGVVLAGNKTLEVAADHQLPVRVVQTDGKELVVVQRTDLRLQGNSKQRERARQLAIADNRTQVLSYTEDVELLLQHAQSVDLGLLYGDDEIKALLASIEPEKTPGDGGDEFDTTPEEAQTRVRYGDLWACGEHRVLCGDSTKAEDVVKLMNGHRASLFATDPPYVVGYKGGSHPSTKSNKGASTKDKDWSSQYHEASSADEGRPFYDQFIKTAIECAITSDAAWYCWHASKRQAMLEDVWTSNGAFVHQQIIWAKSRAVLTYSVYMWQHEPCLFGWQQGNKPSVKTKWDSYPSTIWSIPNSAIESSDHPTSKPIAIFSLPIEMHTKPGGICYEPFSGSGSQLIAAERTNRRCFGIEIEPKFCNVILSRWEAETGDQAKLLERAESATQGEA